MMELQIRTATVDDVDALLQIEEEVSSETELGAYSDDVVRRLVPHTEVLLVDGAVVGLCTSHMLTKAFLAKMNKLGFDFAKPRAPGRRAHTFGIVNIAVKKEFRGRGLGKRLVRRALRKSNHAFVRYTAHRRRHVISNVLASLSYTLHDPVVQEGEYANGMGALRFVFKK